VKGYTAIEGVISDGGSSGILPFPRRSPEPTDDRQFTESTILTEHPPIRVTK